ncbi:hypothetical protein JCM6882_002650 [Rhodosporidiobolus microsporus]
MTPPPPLLASPSAALAALVLVLAAAAPHPASASPSPLPSPPSPPALAPAPAHPLGTPLHLPLTRRNGHLHTLSRLEKREHKQEVVRNWALREAGRVRNKYGAGEEELRKRAMAERGEGEGGATGEGGSEDDGKRRRRRRRREEAQGDAPSLDRRQIVGGVPLSSSSSRVSFNTAGYDYSSTALSSSSPSQEMAETATRTATGRGARQTLPVGLVHTLNYQADLSYYAPVGIGVPAQYMNCILDTGSADLWLASSLCSSLNDTSPSTPSGCSLSTPLYNLSLSRTSLDMNTSFSVRYGSGSAQGEVWQDYVSFAGYNVSSQGFALVEEVSEGLLSGEIGGLMGLGWHPLAASRVTPFWQNLFAASALPFPGFGVSLTRFIDVANASAIEPGGSITFGYLNASLYSSEINYVDIPAGAESYWVVEMEQLAVNGTNVTDWTARSAGGDGGQYVAIDTGTTLIGGPRDVVQAVYAQVEGAMPATGSYTGYYSYPCENNVSVALTFGGITYNMSHADFNLGPFGLDAATNRSTCLGAFFDLSFGSGSRISWVIGAAFLKNVYSVFRASPPSVGFALPPNSSTLHFPSFPSNSSDPARDFNLSALSLLPGGIYGPSAGAEDGEGVSVRTTLVAANTVTTAVMAGGTVGRTNAGAASLVRRTAGESWGALVGGAVVALVVGGAGAWTVF